MQKELSGFSITYLNGDKVSWQYNGPKTSGKNKDRVKSVIYIMDKFCVGDVAYHDFSMTDHEGLPWNYLIKQWRRDLNKLCSITRTPGEWPGAQLILPRNSNTSF